MAGVPDFLEIPQDLQDKIAAATLLRERFFWLANVAIAKDVVTTTLLRRAIYAEQRVVETEFMLGEMGLICEGAKQRVGELQDKLTELAGGK